MSDPQRISLAQGGGGEPMRQLLEELIEPLFDNPLLARREDQAKLPLTLQPGEQLAFTTDSFVVSPLQFPGGDIGTLAVNGTLNDLSVGGARPRYLSCALIIEEGLPLPLLRELCASLASAARQADVTIVTGDTKVVPRGAADGLFINTSGIGVIPAGCDLGTHRMQAGDRLIVSGPVGDHGATILACRQELGLQARIRSDCASLAPLVATILPHGRRLRAMRDTTRGGLAAVLHEFAAAGDFSLIVDEPAVPVREPVRAICELLGLDPLQMACEGRLLAVVDPAAASAVLAAMRAHPLGKDAAMIGYLTPRQENTPVILQGAYGIQRPLPPVGGELLPRIC